MEDFMMCRESHILKQLIMNNIFTANRAGQLCLHKKTSTLIFIRSVEWNNGELNYNVFIPYFDDKFNLHHNVATYSENEIEFLN